MDDLIADFIAEAREGIEALDAELVRFEQNPSNPELLGEVFRLIHTIKGTCGFLGLNRLQAVAHAAETVLGGFRDGSVGVTGEAVSAVLEAVDQIRGLIESLARTGAEAAGDDGALIARLDQCSLPMVETGPTGAPSGASPLLARLGGEASLDAACELALADIAALPAGRALAQADPDQLLGALRQTLVETARGRADLSPLAQALTPFLGETPDRGFCLAVLDLISRRLAQLESAAADVAALVGAVLLPTETPSAGPLAPAISAGEAETAGAQTIRVSVDALEHLMTVASELVLIRNQLLQLLRLEPESPFAAPLHRLNQVASELQEGVMTTRMQPIGGAWAKLPRLVRDLAKDLGKTIDLQMKGQDTELDRQVLELIKDPLTHMIRNAADHGLETPDVRRAAGKAETGRISLSARHEGGAIVIEMADDGAGINAARVRAKAVMGGLITPIQAEAMSDAEARAMIFQPGFSTAEKVTAVSGRGVGMDVVRTNIEKIGGAIELNSIEGQGSRFIIRIPLTLTIISALIVECCGERFALPQSSVIELVSANDASGRAIEQVGGQAVLRLRDRLLPLISLQSLLGLKGEPARGETCIVVAKVGAFAFGVIVDRVFDTEEIVVKPVASVLRHLKLYSGATILGDGSVIMILDFNGMAAEAGASRASAEEEAEAPPAEGGERQAMLVFKAPDGALRAAPLSAVSRIEEVEPGQVERTGERSVIQYRNRLMPVIDCSGQPLDPASLAVRPLLVFARGDRAIGLAVEEIVDIVEAAPVVDLAAAAAGSLGSLIIGGAASELIDIDFFWRRALGEEAPAVEGKRLLIVDRSPFAQILLQPLLSQAGYQVTIAPGAEAALAMHDRGELFDLIMADIGRAGDEGVRLAAVLHRAVAWHGAPMLNLSLGVAGTSEAQVLSAVTDTLADLDRRAA